MIKERVVWVEWIGGAPGRELLLGAGLRAVNVGHVDGMSYLLAWLVHRQGRNTRARDVLSRQRKLIASLGARDFVVAAGLAAQDLANTAFGSLRIILVLWRQWIGDAP